MSKRERQRLHDAQRGTRTERGYSNRWDRARKAYLVKHPLCVYCHRSGRVDEARNVDHIVPHRGDMELFWNSDNWQGLCDTHHNATKQREEATGSVIGCDLDGLPLDAAHHWNRN